MKTLCKAVGVVAVVVLLLFATKSGVKQDSDLHLMSIELGRANAYRDYADEKYQEVILENDLLRARIAELESSR